jgi:hypothetical protein
MEKPISRPAVAKKPTTTAPTGDSEEDKIAAMFAQQDEAWDKQQEEMAT